MDILNNLSKMLRKFPIKTIMIAIIVVILLAIGIRNVFMATGNDTLVKSNTDVFKDNLKLEEEFGGESIVVLYEADNLLTPSHLEHMKGIENALGTNDSIYTIISPVTLVEEIARKQSNQFQDGISEIMNGLVDMGNKLIKISEEIGGNSQSDTDRKHQDMNSPSFEEETKKIQGSYDEFSKQIDEVAEKLYLLSKDIEGPSKKEELEKASQKLGGLSQQIHNLSEDTKRVPTNSDQKNSDLTNIQVQLKEQVNKLNTLSESLSEMGGKLKSISENIETINKYSDIMTPGLPKKQATLDNMIYEDGKLRTMFKEVVVDDNHMVMMIKFNGNVNDSEKSDVVNIINTYLDTETMDSIDTIVSGKPVLDNGIRSSMRESIKQMMGIALLIMIVILSFVFQSRWRLLPLLTVLIAVIGTIGLMGWLQIPITMVSMAVFPILIGLGIDYAIQFQTRYTEEMAKEDLNE